MGLDIYLYTRDQEQANAAHNAASEAFYEIEEWPSDEARTAARNALPPYASQTDVPSERYPEHLFNRRYLRSSYNNGGFDRAVPDMVAKDHGLSWIFQPVRADDEYATEFTETSILGLEQVKARALQVAEELRVCDPLRTSTANAMIGLADHLWSAPPTEEQALAWFREEQARERGGETSSYSCAKGSVFPEGLTVLAVTTGQGMFFGPEAILIYRLDKEVLDSYIQGAEIVAEFCDEAIALARADGSCSMHWSG